MNLMTGMETRQRACDDRPGLRVGDWLKGVGGELRRFAGEHQQDGKRICRLGDAAAPAIWVLCPDGFVFYGDWHDLVEVPEDLQPQDTGEVLDGEFADSVKDPQWQRVPCRLFEVDMALPMQGRRWRGHDYQREHIPTPEELAERRREQRRRYEGERQTFILDVMRRMHDDLKKPTKTREPVAREKALHASGERIDSVWHQPGPRSHCYVCNHAIKDPDSMALGVGPDCWPDRVMPIAADIRPTNADETWLVLNLARAEYQQKLREGWYSALWS